MPRYRSPSPSRSPSPASSYFSRSPSRSRSRSRSRSVSRSRSRAPSRSLSSGRGSLDMADKTDSAIKTSLVFLGSIAAATFAAHKWWPKGVTYGEKEAWEHEEIRKIKRAKQSLQDERRSARRDAGQPSAGGVERRRYVEGRRAGPGPALAAGAAAAAGGAAAESYYYERERRARDFDRPREADTSRERDRERYRDGDRDRDHFSKRSSQTSVSRDRVPVGPGPGAGAVVERRTSRRETNYYPPAPPRIATIESPLPPAGVSIARSNSTSQRPPSRYYYEEEERQKEFVLRDAGARQPRRMSADTYGGGDFDDRRPRGRYADDRYY